MALCHVGFGLKGPLTKITILVRLQALQAFITVTLEVPLLHLGLTGTKKHKDGTSRFHTSSNTNMCGTQIPPKSELFSSEIFKLGCKSFIS